MSPIQRAGYAMLVLVYMALMTGIAALAPHGTLIEYLGWLVIMVGIVWEIVREDFTGP